MHVPKREKREKRDERENHSKRGKARQGETGTPVFPRGRDMGRREVLLVVLFSMRGKACGRPVGVPMRAFC